MSPNFQFIYKCTFDVVIFHIKDSIRITVNIPKNVHYVWRRFFHFFSLISGHRGRYDTSLIKSSITVTSITFILEWFLAMIRTTPPPCINVARAKSSTYLLHFNNAMYIEKGCIRKYEVSALNMKNYNINSIRVPSDKRSTQISAPSKSAPLE